MARATAGEDNVPSLVEDPVPAKRSSTIVKEDGTRISIGELQVPEAMKQLFVELDIDKSGAVTEQNVKDSLKVFKQLKAGLDSDGSGQLTHKEMEDGVDLLTRLLRGKRDNASDMEYKHLPQCIQDVMGEWDADGSGKVSAGELAAAAKAYKKIQKEGRLMRKIILGLTVVILILMIGIFVLSFLAAEAAKEMRGKDDGVMQTPSGTSVKVSSGDFEIAADGSLIIRGTAATNATCPEGQTCRRLGAAGAGQLKVSQAETPRQLSSTLPDAAFKELKKLTLKNTNGSAVSIAISGYQRVYLRSSKCGSIVHLKSPEGEITLDDYLMTADVHMETFLEGAGLGGLFEGEALSGFGRRLSSTDGMLEGFFNLLDDVEWACESVSLPSPDAIPQFYHAKIKVKHLHESPSTAYSYIFTDESDDALLLAGVEKGEDGHLYKTWTEELIKSGALTAYQSQFAMTPFSKEVRVKRGPMQVRMDAINKIGYGCFIEGVEKPTAASVGAAPPKMQFMGIVKESQMVLRHWRLHTVDAEDENADKNLRNMVEAGMLPNVIDYYDVDTDTRKRPVFEAGQPYKVVMQSTVEGAKVYTEKVYMQITALPAALEMEGVLDFFNVTSLDTACKLDKPVESNKNATELRDDMAFLNVTNRSIEEPDWPAPPKMEAWNELPSVVKFHYDRLVRANKAEVNSPNLRLAMSSTYWSSILKYTQNREMLEESLPEDSDDNETNPAVQTFGTGRRLGTVTEGGDDGSYRVRISQADLEASRVGKVPDRHQARRLAHERRLGAASWSFEVEVTNEKVDINLDIGKCKLEVIVLYCHLYSPTSTNWPACQTGRQGAGGVVKLEAYAGGRQVVWPWPRLAAEMSGLLVWDDTSALGCATGVNVNFRPPAARGKYMTDLPGMGSTKTNWKIEAVTGTVIGALGQDARVHIKAPNGKCLGDHRGTVRLVSGCRGWETWRILDAGNGNVYLRSHRGKYLGVQYTGPQPKYGTCKVTVYRDDDCTDGYRTFETTSPTGQEWHFSDDNWESAKAEGHCAITEFFDEDRDRHGYEDNLWMGGAFKCKKFPYDLDDDMSGLKIWAGPPEWPEWEGRLKMYDGKQFESKWQILTPNGSPACSSGSPTLYGGLKFEKDITVFGDFSFGFTTEIAAGSQIHPKHGPFISEVYGKGIVEFGALQVYLYLGFYPDEPWYKKYKAWQVCAKVGYELDLLLTFRDEWTIFCTDLRF